MRFGAPLVDEIKSQLLARGSVKAIVPNIIEGPSLVCRKEPLIAYAKP